MTAPLDWMHETTDIAERGLQRTRKASEAECAALAKALGLRGCGGVSVSYELAPTKSGAWRLSGHIEADVTQACVVTLEPLPAHISEDFSAEFRRTAVIDESGGGERAILSGEDVEPLDRDRIDVGRIVYETLSAALDPYPRKAGVEFSWADPREQGGEGKSNPFAVLKKLKGET